MPGHHPRPQVAQCEDYDSAEDQAIAETRTVANVAAKRKSQSSSLGNRVERAKLGPASDSGYSSRTTGTMGSAESGQQVKDQTVLSKANPSASSTQRRPTLADSRKSSQQGSSKPPSRRTSRTRPPVREQYEDCKDPLCRQCLGSSRPTPISLEPPLDVNHLPFVPSNYRTPPSPPGSNYFSGYPQFLPNVRPPEPRRRPSAAPGPRPMTYHAGMEGYWVPIYGMPPDQTVGPPPSMSAYANMSMPGAFPVFGPTPPGADFVPPGGQRPQSPISPGDQARPAPTKRPSETYSARPRPGSMYGTPNASFDLLQQYPSLTQPIIHQHMVTRGNDPVSLRNDVRDCDCDDCTMPPPRIIQARRPTIKHHHTTYSNVPRSTSGAESVDVCRCHDCDPEATIRAPAHRQRPSLADSPMVGPSGHRTKTVSYPHPSGSKTITIESGGAGDKALRRLSYAGHEKKRQMERERDVKAYQDLSSGGKTSAQLTAEALAKANQRTSEGAPLSRQRSTTHSSRVSGAGSRVSRTSGTKTSGEAGGEGFKIRIGGTDLEFSGDMEVRLRSGKDGEGNTEVVIGSARREVRYAGEERSVRRSESRRTSDDGKRGRSGKRRESKNRSAVGRVNGELP